MVNRSASRTRFTFNGVRFAYYDFVA
jgi:hypothetical protein